MGTSRPSFSDIGDIPTILITEGQVVQQVLHTLKARRGKRLESGGANAGDFGETRRQREQGLRNLELEVDHSEA